MEKSRYRSAGRGWGEVSGDLAGMYSGSSVRTSIKVWRGEAVPGHVWGLVSRCWQGSPCPLWGSTLFFFPWPGIDERALFLVASGPDFLFLKAPLHSGEVSLSDRTLVFPSAGRNSARGGRDDRLHCTVFVLFLPGNAGEDRFRGFRLPAWYQRGFFLMKSGSDDSR